MPDKPLTKAEYALKLLDESDPESAQIAREALKNASKRKPIAFQPLGDETENLLKIHPSFWMNASFIKWQLLKRNKNYEYCRQPWRSGKPMLRT